MAGKAGAKFRQQKGIFSMDHTTNYQLPQWVKSDRIMMDDFNDANSKIDAALTLKCEAVAGTYIGDGASTGQTISLGFTPAAVLSHNISGGNIALALPGYPAGSEESPNTRSSVEGGFQASGIMNYGTGIVHGPYPLHRLPKAGIGKRTPRGKSRGAILMRWVGALLGLSD